MQIIHSPAHSLSTLGIVCSGKKYVGIDAFEHLITNHVMGSVIRFFFFLLPFFRLFSVCRLLVVEVLL